MVAIPVGMLSERHSDSGPSRCGTAFRVVREVWSARALLKRASERCSDRPSLERCSSECQSVAQTDQRRPAVNPACLL